MDIPRRKSGRRIVLWRVGIGLGLLLAVAGATFGVSHLQPALPSVENGSVWPETVKRGEMLRQVHGIGSLVPQDVVWVSAQIDGRIEKIYVQPGTPVKENTVLMDLSNPTLTAGMIAAEYDLKEAEAALADLEVTVEDSKFDKQASAAEIASDYADAKIKAERDRRLVEQGLIPQLDAHLSANLAEQLGRRYQIEQQRVGISDRSAATQLAAQRVKIDQFRAVYELKKEQVAGLHVVAGVGGMLEQLGNAAVTSASGATTPLEVGQNVAAGAILARVAGQDRLKAQVKISETEAKDVTAGQAATIDTRNGLIAGRVSRIDPAAVNGTVLVDVALTGPLPPGARPDLSVDGTIDIERLENVTYMGRPASGQPGGSITLFRLDTDGRTATRVPVKLGRASVNTIEVVSGLRPGDRVILSDMSAVDSHDRIRIN